MPGKRNAARPRRNIDGLTSLYRRWMEFLVNPDEGFDAFHERAAGELRAHGYGRAVFDPAQFPSLYDELPLAGNFEAADLPAAWETVADIQNAATTPLEKLLVAYLWKRGDLWKFGRLLDGIRNVDGAAARNSDRAVMEQFGRHLRDPLNEPIFDQHTARHMHAMKHLARPDRTLDSFVRPAEHTLGEERQRTAYKAWWLQVVMPAIVRRHNEQTRSIGMLWADRTMFSLGKALSLD
jgi:hypothetical protein